ncbi:MAG: hypothetical protein F6K65_25410 [Moorea sp. SIO3C2]|nr:hypothetical protein [Moorena sp. SIO3C2]
MGETTPVAHGGNPQDRTGSPRPRCLPKTALPPQDRNGAFSALRIKFATGRTSASLATAIIKSLFI